MNNNTFSALNGTKTKQNLLMAFDREAGTFARNSIYADAAKRDGDISAGRTLAEHAENDRRAAELWLSYLDEIGDTLENLSEMSSRKDDFTEEFYEELAEIADEEGFYEIAEKFRMSKSVKESHGKTLRDEMEKYGVIPHEDDADTEWVCSVCGYRVIGNTPPETCPLCGFPREYFRKED